MFTQPDIACMIITSVYVERRRRRNQDVLLCICLQYVHVQCYQGGTAFVIRYLTGRKTLCVHVCMQVCLYTYVSLAGWTHLRVSHPSASSHLFFCALSTSTEFSLSLLEMSLNGPVFAIFRRTIHSVHGGVLDSTSISCIYHAHAEQNKQICQPNYPSAFTCIMHQFTPG